MYLCENDKCCNSYRYSVPNNDFFIASAGQLLLACLCISKLDINYRHISIVFMDVFVV